MIGNALKYIRKQKKLNQKTLADALFISQQNLSRYEKEQRLISFDLIEAIANICDYEIFFINKRTGEKFTVRDVQRKD